MNDSTTSQRAALLARLAATRGYPGSRRLAERLTANGITHVYAVSGGPVDELLGACSSAGLTIVGTRGQCAATLAAGAHNFLAGDLRAITVVSAGVAVTNCASGIVSASENHWPVLIIGGRRARPRSQPHPFQWLDGCAAMAPLAKHTDAILAPSQIDEVVDKACHHARSAPYGVSYVDACELVLGTQSQWVGDGAPQSEPAPANVGVADIQPAVALLRKARRPAVVIGSAVRWLESPQALHALTIGWGAPFVSHPLARGFVPDSHPQCANNQVNWLLHSADAVLLVGAELDWVVRHGALIREGVPVVRLGSDRDPSLDDRPGALQLCGDLNRLVGALGSTLDGTTPADRTWLRTLQERDAGWHSKFVANAEPDSPAAALAGIAAALDEHTLVVLDGNVVMRWSERILRADRPLTRLAPGPAGYMGVGVPYAIAACMARPGKSAVVVSGDFALGTSLAELETATRYGLPVIIVLLNNNGNGGAVRQKSFFPAHAPPVSQFVPGARYDQIMEGFGGRGIYLPDARGIESALAEAVQTGLPTLIQVDIRDTIGMPTE